MEVGNLYFYASHLGWPLFPCSARDKAPLTAHGHKDATTDLRQIDAWHAQHPGCAWGVATAADRAVIDIDPRHGGDTRLSALTAQHGPLPPTPKVRTGGGGWHHYLRFPPGTRSGKIGDGIDLKAIGGYVIVPPSRIDLPEHQGRAYAWEVRPWEVPLAEAPGWLLSVKPTPKAGAEANADPWVVRPSGPDLLTHPGCDKSRGEKRTPTLCHLVGIHLARGDSPATVYAAAETWAGRCQPPLEDWQKHVDGLMRKEQAKAEARGGEMTPPSPPCRTTVGITEERGDTLMPEAGREEGKSATAEAEAEDLFSSLPCCGESEQG